MSDGIVASSTYHQPAVETDLGWIASDIEASYEFVDIREDLEGVGRETDGRRKGTCVNTMGSTRRMAQRAAKGAFGREVDWSKCVAWEGDWGRELWEWLGRMGGAERTVLDRCSPYRYCSGRAERVVVVC